MAKAIPSFCKICTPNGHNETLLSGTLRTYQRAGCDRELVTLSCPRGTSISIEIAQYGRSGDANERNLCPASTEDALDISIPGTEIEIKAPESCTWPNALQCPPNRKAEKDGKLI
uniref:Uncharacterized protein n=1 Tax=Anopheles merus TaxID=30066 RepID=A0A182V0C2_ANOME